MVASRDFDLSKKKAIKEVAQSMISSCVNIDSSLQLSRKVLKDTGYEVSTQDVRNVLSKDMNMSYRKITKIALHANSKKNLFLRQRFVVKMLYLS